MNLHNIYSFNSSGKIDNNAFTGAGGDTAEGYDLPYNGIECANSSLLIINNLMRSLGCAENFGIKLNSCNSTTKIHNNTLESGPDGRWHILVGIELNSAFPVISNNTIDGENVTYYGIISDKNFTSTINNNTIKHIKYTGIILNNSQDFTIESNQIYSNGDSGIYIYNSSNVTLLNNHISDNSYGIYLNATNNNSIYHNNFINNTNQAYDNGTNNSWDNGYPSGGNYWSDYNGTDTMYGASQNYTGADGFGDWSYNITGSANSTDDYPLMGPIIDGRFMKPSFRIDSDPDFTTKSWIAPSGSGTENDPWVIENYYINGSGEGYCACVGNTTDYFVIENCKLYDASGNSGTYFWNSGLTLYNATNGQVSNIKSESSYYGILLCDSDDNEIDNCSSKSNNHGIYLAEDSDSNTIEYNQVTSSTEDGIIIDESDENTLNNNVASLNIKGIFINDAENNTVRENTLTTNDYGLYSEDSYYNIINDNTVSSNNDYGLYINGDSNNNTIYHNFIISNTNQSHDSGSDNDWDNGYPSGGNYWSDYNGTDLLGGSGQNLSGSDGIGDWTYNNTGSASSVDNYPIMSSSMNNYVYWAKSFGGGSAEYLNTEIVINTDDGGCIMGGHGYTNSSGNYDLWVQKLSANGSVEWGYLYGGTGVDGAMSIQQTYDEEGGNVTGYIVAGYTASSPTAGAYDVWVIKLYLNGTDEWQKRYGGASYDVAYSIKQTFASNGTTTGFIIGGYTRSSGSAGGTDFWVLKINNTGGSEWDSTYGGSYDEICYSIEQTSDGGFIATGRTQSFGAGNKDAWVLKLNSTGSVEWNSTFGGTGDDWGYDITQTDDDSDGERDDGYILTGYTKSYGGSDKDIWVIKLNSSGNITWQNTYGGANDDFAISIIQTTDGGFITTGGTKSYGVGDEDLWVIKLDSDGNVSWQKAYGGTNMDRGYEISETSDGYVVSGLTVSFGEGSYDGWVLKVGPSGEFTFDYGTGNVTVSTASASSSATTPGTPSSTSVSSITVTVATTTHNETEANYTVNVQATYNYGWC